MVSTERQKTQHSVECADNPAVKLKSKLKELSGKIPDNLALRVHRAISWLRQAEQIQAKDKDTAFIFLWIAFNAGYATATNNNYLAFDAKYTQKNAQSDFFVKVVDLDKENHIYNTFWDNFSESVQLIIANKYIFQPFWRNIHDKVPPEKDKSDMLFEKENEFFRKAFEWRNTAKVLSVIFSRLYTLRNQIIHGGATHNSRVNRRQLEDGVSLLSCMIPLFIDIMLENPVVNWGEPIYPPINN